MKRTYIVGMGTVFALSAATARSLPIIGGPQANDDSAPALPIYVGSNGIPTHGWAPAIVSSSGYPESFQQASTFDGQMVGNGLSGSSKVSGVLSFDMPTLQPAANTLRLNAINESRIAVGRSTSNKPVRWDTTSVAPEVLNMPLINGNAPNNGEVFDINAVGTAIGYSNWAARYRALRWLPGSVDAEELNSINLSPNGLPGDAAPRDINDGGDVVGYSVEFVGGIQPYSRYRAVKWSSVSTAPTPLARGGNSDFAYALNEDGVTVGCTDFFRAARWDASGQNIERLGTTDDGQTSYAWDINKSGTSVGWAVKSDQNSVATRYQALRWDAGTTASVYLQNLATPSNYEALSLAIAINDLGYVAGSAYRLASANGTTAGMGAAIWRPDTTAIDLSLLVEASSGWKRLSIAYGVTLTGFVNGVGVYDPDGAGSAASYNRVFLMLVPQAGTYGRGDANFDTRIDFDDLLILAQHYGESNLSQNIHVGDFDLNGAVDFDDLLALAQHYEGAPALDASQFGGAFASDWALARSIVPEPLLGAVAIGTGVVSRRRRV